MTSQSDSGVSYVELSSGVDRQVPGLVVEFELLADLTLKVTVGAEVDRHLVPHIGQVRGERWAGQRPADDAQRHSGVRASRRCCAKARVGPDGWPASTVPPAGRTWCRSRAQAVRSSMTTLVERRPGGSCLPWHPGLPGTWAQLWTEAGVRGGSQAPGAGAGDSACGFGNTAMTLADTRHIPKVWFRTTRLRFSPTEANVDVG